jgi:hypothetical protein
MNRQPGYAQFNKLNKKFVTIHVSDQIDYDLLNHDNFLYREIEIDVELEVVTGDYDNYSVVAIADQPLEIYEDALNDIARAKITEQYPLEAQLSIIGELLERLADNAGIEAEAVKEMNDFINEVRRQNGVRKDFYAASNDYVYKTTEDSVAEIEELEEGGISTYDDTVGDL